MNILFITKMKSFVFYITTFFLMFGYTWSHSISYRRPCRNVTPECLKNTLQSAIPLFAKGAPELGLEPLDPYVLEQLNLTLSGITINFKQGYAKGLKTCTVDFARLVDDTLEVQLHCDLIIHGKYKSSGSLLMFPIDGDGDSTIKCDNLKLYSKLKLGSQVKDGQHYLAIKNSVTKHAYDGRVTYLLNNLFKGNPDMSNAVLNFMNSNWRLVAEEFGTPIVDYGVNFIMRNVRRFFEIMPLDELKKL